MGQPKIQPEQVEILQGQTSVCSVFAADANQNKAANVSHILTFNTELIDTDGWFTPSSPTRLTVPPGITRAKFSATCWLFTGGTYDPGRLIALRILKNNTPTVFIGSGMGANAGLVDNDDTVLVMTPWLIMNEGDYFQLEFFHQMTAVTNLSVHDVRFDVEGV